MYCKSCNLSLKLCRYKKSIDGEAFRCYKSNCNLFRKYISIRKQSFFEGYNIELRKLIMLCYKWFINEEQVKAILDLNIYKMTCQKIYKSLRIRYFDHFINNSYSLGGPGIICQLDGSMFKYNQKYHVGRISSENR